MALSSVPDSTNVTSVSHFLKASQFSELEAQLAAVQQFEAGQCGELALTKAFEAFEQADPSWGEALSGWVEAFPTSYAAHTALATWLLARAWAFRGGTTANLISDRGQRGMQYFLEQAEGAARHATRLSENPLAAWLIVGQVDNTRGCDLSLTDLQARAYPDWYSQPLVGNPGSLLLRKTLLRHLRTEWGGSEAHMLAFVRQQDESDLSATDRSTLWAQYHASVSHHARFFGDDPVKGLEHARMAADLKPQYVDTLLQAVVEINLPAARRLEVLERWLKTHEQSPELALDHNTAWALLQSRELLPELMSRLGSVLKQRAEAQDFEAITALGLLKLHEKSVFLPDPMRYLVAFRERGHVFAAEIIADLERHDRINYMNAALKAADLGSERLSWEVYADFEHYRQDFDLDDRTQYRYLARAADAGNNDARYTLAQLLRSGEVEMGDGVLRPVKTRPLQDSLDYAKHLLERAAAEGHKAAAKALRAAKPQDWDAKQAAHRTYAYKMPKACRASAQSSGRPYRSGWWAVLLMLALLRLLHACSDQNSRASSGVWPPSPELTEQSLISSGTGPVSAASPR